MQPTDMQMWCLTGMRDEIHLNQIGLFCSKSANKNKSITNYLNISSVQTEL